MSWLRVARWFIYRPKITIWVYFRVSCDWKCWYILWPFLIFYGNWVYVLYCHMYGIYFASFGTVFLFWYVVPRNIWQPCSRSQVVFWKSISVMSPPFLVKIKCPLWLAFGTPCSIQLDFVLLYVVDAKSWQTYVYGVTMALNLIYLFPKQLNEIMVFEECAFKRYERNKEKNTFKMPKVGCN
jgi:hypothetical protein